MEIQRVGSTSAVGTGDQKFTLKVRWDRNTHVSGRACQAEEWAQGRCRPGGGGPEVKWGTAWSSVPGQPGGPMGFRNEELRLGQQLSNI